MRSELKRQEVIKSILGAYGAIDHLDCMCLGVRFKVGPEVISEDIRQVRAKQEEEVRVQKRAELAQAKRFLRGEA